MRAVESHSFRRFSRFGRRLEDALPNSLRTPAVEAIVDRLVLATPPPRHVSARASPERLGSILSYWFSQLLVSLGVRFW